MTSITTKKIAEYSKTEIHESLIALMNYYGKSNLKNISEEQALVFLDKVKSGEIKIEDYLDKP